MTEDRLRRLPELAQAIIHNDRELAVLRRSDVVLFERYRDGMERRQAYLRHARQAWGSAGRSDGPANQA